MKKHLHSSKLLVTCLFAGLLFTNSSGLLAQTATVSAPDRITQLEQQVKNAQGSADNAWMLVSAALVLM
ncbi:MAG TPA: hypothetical protein VJ453_07090, partial [Terriglobales bacterium]|nr:hypothetical protein [Terriglobales bacterium]